MTSTIADDPFPELVRQLKHPAASSRAKAARSLGRLGWLAREALPALAAATADGEKHVREAAAVAEFARAFDASGDTWVDGAIAGGGDVARPVMISRILGGDPMGAFQFNHGRQAEELIEAVGLTTFLDVPAGELSYGRKRALEIATTLALDPEMMLLDEPMAGMGHEDIARIAALIRKVSANRTILMVEHILSVVADLSDTITVLQRGEVLAEGPYAQVSRNPAVVEAYMGTGHG